MNHILTILIFFTTATAAAESRLKCELTLQNGDTKKALSCEAPLRNSSKLKLIELEKSCAIDFGTLFLVAEVHNIVEGIQKTRADLTVTIHRNIKVDPSTKGLNTSHSSSTNLLNKDEAIHSKIFERNLSGYAFANVIYQKNKYSRYDYNCRFVE